MWAEPIDVRYVEGYQLEVVFSDGLRATVDFAQRINDLRGLGAQLKDVDLFRQTHVDHELGTLVWANGLGIRPNLLYSLTRRIPVEEDNAYRRAN